MEHLAWKRANARKCFPKNFELKLQCQTSVYSLYRRCPSDTTFVREREMDNRFVVPYNPYLLLKYNAHISVEVSTSLRAVKYIYKGLDCANMVLSAG
ncbi:hypothetical protein AVEN_61226-1 [Araneus ventricosus]|uniref:Helitron helicase-like domain-containing protein n=1 Tax=Araneus ventricosus TaxID=182803 RepID=A0A4Y2JVC0_ARAVE|nr:hypothetical protein AVEN_61226-1 [Araneus ventricosus]